MATYYEKRLATELPKVSAYFNTDRGELWYDIIKDHWVLSPGSGSIEYPSIWWEPLPSPIPSMTLEEARQKNRIVNKDKYKSLLKETMSPEAVSIVVENDFAELYLQHNTLSLKQEVEELKEKLKGAQKTIF